MIVGNVMAVIQENVKRLLAYSSIAHAGYLLIGLVAGTPEGYAAVLFYLLAYLFTNLGAFGVIVALANRGQDASASSTSRASRSARPGLAALMTLFMISLAGIPGTAASSASSSSSSPRCDAGQVALTILARADERGVGLLLPAPAGAHVHARAGRGAAAAAPAQRRGHRAAGLRRRRDRARPVPQRGPALHAIDWTRESAAVLAGR